MDTNLDREQILGFYNVFKKVLLSTDSLTDGNDVISMQRTYLNGSDGHLHDYLVGSEVYEFLPSYNSLNAIVKAMKINLGLEEEEYDTSFTFSIDHPYEQKIIGKDVWGGVKNYPQPEKKPETKTCGTNEELGADGQTCVCKNGYEKDSKGVCVKDDDESGSSSKSHVNECVSENGGYYWYTMGNEIRSWNPSSRSLDGNSDSKYGFRVVIKIKDGVLVSSGDGTKEDPYTIK